MMVYSCVDTEARIMDGFYEKSRYMLNVNIHIPATGSQESFVIACAVSWII